MVETENSELPARVDVLHAVVEGTSRFGVPTFSSCALSAISPLGPTSSADASEAVLSLSTPSDAAAWSLTVAVAVAAVPGAIVSVDRGNLKP